jgi:exonuclease SbcC
MIEESITRAISLYNAQKSGRKYHALFTDEKDGALDFQKKKEFIAMKKKVLEIGGYDTEFFISQSPEVQETADVTIAVNGYVVAIA